MNRDNTMTARSESLPPTFRSGRGLPEPDRFSTEYFEVVQDVGAPAPVMVDSYLAKFDSCLPLNTDNAYQDNAHTYRDNAYQDNAHGYQDNAHTYQDNAHGYGDNAHTILSYDTLTTGKTDVPHGRYSKKSNDNSHKSRYPKTASQHAHGLSIMTWDEFVENPHLLNTMFSLEKNEFISHDPNKLNVFFQDCRMLQPTLGTLSSNGMSWTIYIDSYAELKSVRAWLTERVSVLVVSLVNKNKKRQADLGERASCLIAMDPHHSSVKEKLYLALSQAMDSFLRQRLFSVMINLNQCVEEWCQDVLRMRCDAEGAKLIITNGDEYMDCSDINVNACLGVFCLPIRLIQGATYRVQRRVNYDDYSVDFDDDRLYLCTANTKLQTYAEKTYSTVRKTKRKKNVLKSTMSTQTINGVLGTAQYREEEKRNHEKKGAMNKGFDCDLEDLERGDEAETLASTRTLRSNVDHIHGMVFQPKSSRSVETTDNAPVPKPRAKVKETMKQARQRTPRKESCSSEIEDNETFKTPWHERQRCRVDTEADVHAYNNIPDRCGATQAQVHSVTHEIIEERRNSNVSSSQDIGIFSRSSSITHSISTTDVVSAYSNEYVQNGNIPIGVFDDIPSNVTQSRTRASDMMVLSSEQAVAQPTRQQKRISKMLKDIMGPGADSSSINNNDAYTKSRRNQPKQSIIAGSNHYGKTATLTSENASYCSEDSPSGVLINRFSRNSMRRSVVARKVADFIYETSNNIPGEIDVEDTPLRSGKVRQIRQHFAENDETKLFTPRFMLDNDRNCFSDHDPGGDMTDADPDSVMSDTEVMTSPRLINVQNTDRTISVNSVTRAADTDLELTDCDADDSMDKRTAPKLRPKPPQKRGTRGQFDSRRRYLALNSLRRKTKLKNQQTMRS